MNEVKLAAGYIRVSTVEQSLKGLSIETQIAEIKNYAQLHNMKLVGVYIDRGITARKSLEKRVEFMNMMHDVEAGKINHIIVLRLDRFFRNVYDYHKMMNEYLNPNNCDWSAVKEQYTTTTTNGRLMINLRLAIAEQECDTDSDRIKDVLNHRASQGFAITGTMPIGLKIVDHRVVPDDDNKHIVQDAFNYFEMNNSVRGTMMYINNTYDLNLLYITMSRILRNEKYKGKLRDNENYCEPIVSKEQFDRVQKLLNKNIKVRSDAQEYVFTGLLKCDVCGRNLGGNCTHVHGDVYRYYRCPRKARDGNCENRYSCNEIIIENYLLENVEQLISNYIVSTEIEEKEKRPVKSNRKQIEQKLQRLNDLYVNNFIDMEKYKADYALLQSQIIDVPQEEKKDFTELKKFLEGDFKSIYKTLSDKEKRTLWRSVIKEIRMNGTEIKSVDFL